MMLSNEKKFLKRSYFLIVLALITIFGSLIANFIKKESKKGYLFTSNFGEILKDESRYTLDMSKSTIYNSEIKSIDSEIAKAKKELGIDDLKKAKLAVLNKDLTSILYKSGATNFVSVTNSAFLIPELKELRADFPYNETYYCNDEFNQVFDIYLDDGQAHKLIGEDYDAGCYLYQGGDYTLQPNVIPQKRTYDISKSNFKYHNYGDRYKITGNILKKQGVNLVIVDKVFSHFYWNIIDKIKKENITVIEVATNNLESEMAVVDKLLPHFSLNTTLLTNFTSNHHRKVYDLKDSFKPEKVGILKPKVALNYRFYKKTYIYKDNSYLASWLNHMGFEVIAPKDNFGTSTERIELDNNDTKNSYKKVAEYKDKVDYIITSTDPILPVEWYVKNDPYWDAQYYPIESFAEATYQSADQMSELAKKLKE